MPNLNDVSASYKGQRGNTPIMPSWLLTKDDDTACHYALHDGYLGPSKDCPTCRMYKEADN